MRGPGSALVQRCKEHNAGLRPSQHTFATPGRVCRPYRGLGMVPATGPTADAVGYIPAPLAGLDAEGDSQFRIWDCRLGIEEGTEGRRDGGTTPLRISDWGLRIDLPANPSLIPTSVGTALIGGARSPMGCIACAPGVIYPGGRSVLDGDAVRWQLATRP